MNEQVRPPPADKFKRYRAKKKAEGKRLVRRWVIDVTAPGFAEEARRQSRLLRGQPEEVEALDFIEATMDNSGWVWED